MGSKANNQEKYLNRLLEVGVAPAEAEKTLLLLGGREVAEEVLDERLESFLTLSRACGTHQNAKLAYSLATRSGLKLGPESVPLLAKAVRCSSCVPAGVRLWKTALEAGATDPTCLATAALLGEDGSEQIRVLNRLKAEPEKLADAAELAQRLAALGWEAEGSWGTYLDADLGLVWWDYAAPTNRRSYGMTLSTGPIDLTGQLGTVFRFQARHQIQGTTDRCHLEVSLDNRRWEKLLKFDGVSDWAEHSVELTRFRDKRIYLRFHVLSGGQRVGRGIEVAGLRLETVPAAVHRDLSLPPGEGWVFHPSDRGQEQLVQAVESEQALLSEPFQVRDGIAPTLAWQAKLASSSVYAEAWLEVLDSQDEVLAQLLIDGTSDWSSYTLPLPAWCAQDGEAWLRLRLWSRFAKRKDDDGFWIRRLGWKAGMAEEKETLWLHGSVEDGALERKQLLELLEQGSSEEVSKLARLRRGLPSLKSALALARIVAEEEHVPALLLLFSSLREQAVPAFGLLRELAHGEDLLLQSRVLLTSGLEHYASTRDHLGAGLVSGGEFEEHCRLYLLLREQWDEEQARRGLSLLLTPVANEEPAQRTERFQQLFGEHTDPEQFFKAWHRSWAG